MRLEQSLRDGVTTLRVASHKRAGLLPAPCSPKDCVLTMLGRKSRAIFSRLSLLWLIAALWTSLV
jgi:hypothetical protein